MTADVEHFAIRSELERKVIDEITRLHHNLMAKGISKREYLASVLTLWNTTAGLVASETMTAVANLSKNMLSTPDLPHDQSGKFMWAGFKAGSMAVVSLTMGESFVRVEVHSAKGITMKEIHADIAALQPSASAHEKFNLTVASLKGSGFITVL